MDWIKKCPVLFLLAVSGIILTAAGIAGRNSIYKEYDYNFLHTPFLALTLEGADKGVYPWELLHYGKPAYMASSETANEYGGQSIEMPGEEGQEQTASGSMPADQAAGEGSGRQEPGEAGSRTYDFETVTEEYFKDAVFIGDSRTVGLFEYSGLADYADFYAKISLTIYDVFTDPVVKDEETGKKITIEQALSNKQYGKIYLMLGINELGTGTVDSFMEEYKRVVNRLRQLQPDAVIFTEGIMRVTGAKSEADPIFNNANINARNEEIAKLADNRDIFYIDVNEVISDGQGNLNEDYTTDEIHLKAQYYELWKQFLFAHGIVRD